jgi:hypothetical protein
MHIDVDGRAEGLKDEFEPADSGISPKFEVQISVLNCHRSDLVLMKRVPKLLQIVHLPLQGWVIICSTFKLSSLAALRVPCPCLLYTRLLLQILACTRRLPSSSSAVSNCNFICALILIVKTIDYVDGDITFQRLYRVSVFAKGPDNKRNGRSRDRSNHHSYLTNACKYTLIGCYRINKPRSSMSRHSLSFLGVMTSAGKSEQPLWI